MTVVAPNVSWLLQDRPLGERLGLVAEAGFEAIEIGFYGRVDIGELMTAKEQCGLRVVLLNMDVPDWGAGKRGYLADPTGKEAFKAALDRALMVGVELRAEKLMLPVGALIPDLTPEVQRASIVDNLNYAAELAERAGIIITIEALSPTFAPDYFINSSAAALDIVRTVNHPRVKFQFDTFHLQTTEGNLINTLRANINMIGHIQFADVPGRTEPGHGELNFCNIARAADDAGYDSYIGLEYVPVSPGVATLDWVPPNWRRSLPSRSSR